MSQDVPWGFYIAQLTFLAVPAVLLCPLFVLVDLGQPSRAINIFLHPQLNSMLFWEHREPLWRSGSKVDGVDPG
jgi:hypothetical protein